MGEDVREISKEALIVLESCFVKALVAIWNMLCDKVSIHFDHLKMTSSNVVMVEHSICQYCIINFHQIDKVLFETNDVLAI
jgi:hypothetical protein